MDNSPRDPTVQTLRHTPVSMGRMKLHGGFDREVVLGLGSGLSRCPKANDGTFWGIADRGPNIKPEAAGAHYASLLGLDGAKILPRLDLGPTLAQLSLQGEEVVLERILRITLPDGTGISGLPPAGDEDVEPGFDVDMQPLQTDPDGLDPEGVAVLPNGWFAVAEEYGPSIVFVDPEGVARHRWVPQGLEARFKGAKVPVLPVLPAIAARRRLNRGFEAVALSVDGRRLFVSFQSPLTALGGKKNKAARWVRVWALTLESGAFEGEWLYPFDHPDSFPDDGKVKWADLKVCDLQAFEANGLDRLVVLERVSATTKLYSVTLDPLRASPIWTLDPLAEPSVEDLSQDDNGSGLTPLDKHLLLNSTGLNAIGPDQEGLVFFSPTCALLVNDDDWGTDGARTVFSRVEF